MRFVILSLVVKIINMTVKYLISSFKLFLLPNKQEGINIILVRGDNRILLEETVQGQCQSTLFN